MIQLNKVLWNGPSLSKALYLVLYLLVRPGSNSTNGQL